MIVCRFLAVVFFCFFKRSLTIITNIIFSIHVIALLNRLENLLIIIVLTVYDCRVL